MRTTLAPALCKDTLLRLRELYSVGIFYIIVTKVNKITGDTKLNIVLDVNNVTM